ncbi:lysoplasmalogenase [Humibacter ginsenosidimutans]|uniref:Lysoplasmalogenase n=1 Tax=Humibacter ginsenosidimutans TaxID=2599293 RepID=A0A5B8M0Z7_9MICO|nr:lysoplasmalogenase [Humibacter ginsenosidimutans]QDZ13495.1 lysoplasmalogenase [Humibacter ginsenosidimutans]
MSTVQWRAVGLLAFVPFAIVSVMNVVAEAVGADDLAGAVKPLIIPLLALAFIVLGPRRPLAPCLVLLLALLFAWLGDIAPTFIVMLAFFLCMQIVYIVLFWRYLRRSRPAMWSVVYAAWWLVLLVLVGPSSGPLFVPVAVYGLALGAMAVLATGTTMLTTIGAALFLLSDSVLGITHFVPSLVFPGHDAVVMLTYTAGQLLIVLGVGSALRRGEAAAAGRLPLQA